MLRFGSREQIEEGGGVIPVFVKHGRAAVAAIEDMEGIANQVAARNAGYGESTYDPERQEGK